MLFAVSGPQGSGKSTVLAEIESRGYEVVRRKTSRSILSDWGVTLSQVNNDRELTVKFQNEILKRKMEDEAPYIESKKMCFTERSYADLFAYALVSLGKDNEHSNFIDDYFKQCAIAQANIAGTYFLDQVASGDVVGDGVRAINGHYNVLVNRSIQRALIQMRDEKFIPKAYDTIHSIDNATRVNDIIIASTYIACSKFQ